MRDPKKKLTPTLEWVLRLAARPQGWRTSYAHNTTRYDQMTYHPDSNPGDAKAETKFYALLTAETIARFRIAAVFGWPEKVVAWCVDNGLRPNEWVTWWPTNSALRAFNPFGLAREAEVIAAFAIKRPHLSAVNF